MFEGILVLGVVGVVVLAIVGVLLSLSLAGAALGVAGMLLRGVCAVFGGIITVVVAAITLPFVIIGGAFALVSALLSVLPALLPIALVVALIWALTRKPDAPRPAALLTH